MHVFQNNFTVPVLLQFLCVEFPTYELFYYANISNEDFGLDTNLFIVYNFDFIIANGNFL